MSPLTQNEVRKEEMVVGDDEIGPGRLLPHPGDKTAAEQRAAAAEALAAACFSANSFLQALATWLFWSYVSKRTDRFAARSDPKLLRITSRVWLVISIGWLISIALGFANVYAAYVSWVLWPNLVALWANRQRQRLQAEAAHPKAKRVSKKERMRRS